MKARKKAKDPIDPYELELVIEYLKEDFNVIIRNREASKSDPRLLSNLESVYANTMDIFAQFEAEIRRVMKRCSLDDLPIEEFLDDFIDGNEIQHFLWGSPSYANLVPFREAAEAWIEIYYAKDLASFFWEHGSDPNGHSVAFCESVNNIEALMKKMRLVELSGNDYAQKKSQSDKAKKTRSIIPGLVARLVRQHPQKTTSVELWPHLIALLDEEVHVPKEKRPHKMNPKTWSVVYITDTGQKTLGFPRFRNLISQERKKTSR